MRFAIGSVGIEQRSHVLSQGRSAPAFGSALQEARSWFERGSYRPLTNVNIDMLRAAHEKFLQEPDVVADQVVTLAEITMHNLKSEGEVNLQDFLARVDLLAACGMTVLISDYFEYYRLAAYLARYTKNKIGITMGAASLCDLFDEKYYTELDGGILESFGRLFKNDLKLLIYPLLDRATGNLTTVENLEVAPELRNLYHYLVDKGCIVQLDNFNPDNLATFSREVLKMIQTGDPNWAKHVPNEVAEVIQRRGFFGYRRNAVAKDTTKPMLANCIGQLPFTPGLRSSFQLIQLN